MDVCGIERARSINQYIEADGAHCGYNSVNDGFEMVDSGFEMVDAGFEMVDAGFEILDGDFDIADGIECMDGASPPMQGTSMLLDMFLLST